jgi:peptide-methionine (S)-S-oxide reductase
VRTRVGYAGGNMEEPTYRDLGGHTEAIQIDYDASRIRYEDLLDVFWSSHAPTAASWSTQYKNVLWYHDATQHAAALATRDRIAAENGEEVRTEILPAPTFWRAEDYHQKYRLRGRDALENQVRGLYETEIDFVDSTLAARLNGRLAGYTVSADDPELSDREREVLLRASR